MNVASWPGKNTRAGETERGKVIHRELCKIFDHTDKWFMHKPDTALENKTHNIFLDFEIKMDHPIPARRLDFVVIDKKKQTHWLIDIPADHRVKIKASKKTRSIPGSCQRVKTLRNTKVKMIPIIIEVFGTIPRKEIGRTRNLWKNWDCSDLSRKTY